MQTVLFVPGFQEDINTRKYTDTLEAIKNKGYDIKFIPIEWNRTTIEDWLRQFEKEYVKYDASTTILAGFSYGSMTVFLAATRRTPAALWLFSFSPYFSDDIPKLKDIWLKNVGKHRVDAFRKLNFDLLAKRIKCKTLIFVGENEAKKYPLIDNRAKLAVRAIRNSALHVVAGAGHDVTHPKYIDSIAKSI